MKVIDNRKENCLRNIEKLTKHENCHIGKVVERQGYLYGTCNTWKNRDNCK